MIKSTKGSSKLSLEGYFLRYAFPCTYVIKQRGEVGQKTFDLLEQAALRNKPVKRELLEKTYKKAFERMKRVAASMKKRNFWSFEVVKEYFTRRHNKMIDDGDGSYAIAPKVFRELCKVHLAEIIDSKDGFFIVKYGKGKTRVVASHYLPQANIGDKIMIHHGYAVEIAED